MLYIFIKYASKRANERGNRNQPSSLAPITPLNEPVTHMEFGDTFLVLVQAMANQVNK